MFPYTCEKCGGAYVRCGYDKCKIKNCSGGQFCYEDNVVILVNGKKYDGVYDGYGQVYVGKETIYIPTEFNEHIDSWRVKLEYNPEKTKVTIYCKSCF